MGDTGLVRDGGSRGFGVFGVVGSGAGSRDGRSRGGGLEVLGPVRVGPRGWCGLLISKSKVDWFFSFVNLSNKKNKNVFPFEKNSIPGFSTHSMERYAKELVLPIPGFAAKYINSSIMLFKPYVCFSESLYVLLMLSAVCNLEAVI